MFITLEGPEGSGKSTQARLLAAYLRECGRDVVVTREPGGTAIGDQVRTILHDTANTSMSAEAEILLYSASRAQLVSEVIRPGLARGALVVCDRFADSTLAYQGYGRGLDLDELRAITHFATGGLVPNLTILLDIDVSRGLARRRDKGEEMNRLDLEEDAFHRRVRAGYQALSQADTGRWHVVDADRAVAAVHTDLRRIVDDALIVAEPEARH